MLFYENINSMTPDIMNTMMLDVLGEEKSSKKNQKVEIEHNSTLENKSASLNYLKAMASKSSVDDEVNTNITRKVADDGYNFNDSDELSYQSDNEESLENYSHFKDDNVDNCQSECKRNNKIMNANEVFKNINFAELSKTLFYLNVDGTQNILKNQDEQVSSVFAQNETTENAVGVSARHSRKRNQHCKHNCCDSPCEQRENRLIKKAYYKLQDVIIMYKYILRNVERRYLDHIARLKRDAENVSDMLLKILCYDDGFDYNLDGFGQNKRHFHSFYDALRYVVIEINEVIELLIEANSQNCVNAMAEKVLFVCILTLQKNVRHIEEMMHQMKR